MSLPSLPDGLITPRQEQLLQVIFGPAEGAEERFRIWEQGLDLTDLDKGSYRLYPQLYRRIRDFAPDHPFLQRLKGVFRHTFFRNQLLFRWALEVIDRLTAANIDCIVLKGASLVSATALSAGMRPMADVDLLVPTRDAERALHAADPGFGGLLDAPDRMRATVLLRHGLTVRDGNDLQIDLHWRLADIWRPGADLDRLFWDRAETVTLQGRAIRVLAPTELLYHLVVHGVPRNPTPPIRWIADALELIAADGERIDWTRLVGVAHHYRRRLLLGTGLAYLAGTFAAPVPPDVLRALGEPVDMDEQAEFDLLTRDWSPPDHLPAARRVAPMMLPVLNERVPGHGLVVYMTDASLRPSILEWVRGLGAEFVCEFSPDSAIGRVVRTQIAAHGPPPAGQLRLLRFEVAEGRLPVRHLYADLRRPSAGDARLRVFCTSLRSWPAGAVVLRLDRPGRMLLPDLVGAQAIAPGSACPIWPGLFTADAFRPG
ncbi:hypothetical protein STAQ_09400 [Allostella sp. ATCC 35155]|nr:hypothetical protein STAQ_09400 [Stella sp. ATCC 35155]